MSKRTNPKKPSPPKRLPKEHPLWSIIRMEAKGRHLTTLRAPDANAAIAKAADSLELSEHDRRRLMAVRAP